MDLANMMKPGAVKMKEGKGGPMGGPMMLAKVETALKERGVLKDDDDLMEMLGWTPEDLEDSGQRSEDSDQEPADDEALATGAKPLMAGHPAMAAADEPA